MSRIGLILSYAASRCLFEFCGRETVSLPWFHLNWQLEKDLEWKKNNVKVKILHSRDTKFDVIVNFDDTLEQWFLPLTPSSRDMLGLSTFSERMSKLYYRF